MHGCCFITWLLSKLIKIKLLLGEVESKLTNKNDKKKLVLGKKNKTDRRENAAHTNSEVSNKAVVSVSESKESSFWSLVAVSNFGS